MLPDPEDVFYGLAIHMLLGAFAVFVVDPRNILDDIDGAWLRRFDCLPSYPVECGLFVGWVLAWPVMVVGMMKVARGR